MNTAESTKVRVVSLDVDVYQEDALRDWIRSKVVEGASAYVCLSTVHMVMEGVDDPEFRTIVNAADLVLPDGMPLVWMQKVQGVSNPQRIRGNDLMTGLLDFSEETGMSVGFYGGTQSVLDAIAERIGAEHPDLEVSYSYSPPFRTLTVDELDAVIGKLEKTKPDILFVGLGCPKQERWMFENRERVKSLMIGVGAAFDFYAGETLEAPKGMQRMGLEWLYRLSQEPKRLWKRYLILNPRFVFLAIRQLSGFRKIK